MGQTNTKWWTPEGNRIACNLCPRHCLIPEGSKGFCFVRENLASQLVLTTYGRSTGFCIDPIEKKPLNHFLPGTPVLSFGTAGCNLGCKFCQNWDISKSRAIEIASDEASPEQIIQLALERGVQSLAFTYNDPVIWAEYAIDCAKLAQANGIKTVAVTAGYITAEARPEFFQHMDAANVDLKAFTEEFYKNITFAQLKPVLETLVWLKRESNVWFEITNLIIPEENDSEDEIAQMSDWICENLGAEVPLHFSAFHPDFKMLDRPRTPPETLRRAREQAQRAGLKYVYVGNIHDSAASSTYCPKCNNLLIERDWYKLGAYNLVGNACKFCGENIPGVFVGNQPGDWGEKREPVSISTSVEELLQLRKKKSSEIKRGQREKIVHTSYSQSEKETLLHFARSVVNSAVLQRPNLLSTLPKKLAESPCYGVFVSLKNQGALRACIGRWGEIKPLLELLAGAAEDSALRDQRFPQIEAEELDQLSIEISLMYDPLLIEEGDPVSIVKPGVHGIVLLHPQSRGLLLPQVATENGWSSLEFLNHLSKKAGLHTDAWREGKILTFKADVFSSTNKDKSGNSDRTVRQPAVAGAFYPADAASIENYLRSFFQNRPQQQGHERSKVSALLLPHAGWNYCGEIIAQTLIGKEIPDLCFIIGPKHTGLGSRWAFSSQSSFAFPGGAIEVDQALVRFLHQSIAGTVLDDAAHLNEHSIEVLVPFLKFLNPNTKIIPLVLGSSSLEEITALATQLGTALQSLKLRPLFIISSDMNHFENLEDTIRKDGQAISCMLKSNAEELYQTCKAEGISMCGVIPATLVIKTLKLLGQDCNPKLVARATSAAINGDTSRVVGYAGLSF